MQKKDRIPVVFDTSFFMTRYIKHNPRGLNRRVFDLWRDHRRLQLIISPPVKEEYLYILEKRARLAPETIKLIEYRLDTASNVTTVNLGKRFTVSRDPNDDMFLDTAHAGRAKYIVSRDDDLLTITPEELRGLRFQIVNPFQFLQSIGEI